MTPTPRSRAGSSVTSRPCRITFPVYGISSPAMMRRIVVLPLPEAPSSTRTSPSATSKLMFSSTLALPKRLLMPTTLAAAVGPAGSGSSRLGMSDSLAFTDLVNVQPVTCEKQHTENQKRKQREHDRDRVRGFDLTFVELRENVERGGLSASGEIAGDKDRRTEFADGTRESKQGTGNDRAAQRRQRDVPERLPARRADRGGSFFKRAAHRVEHGFDDAECERKSDEDVCEDDGARSEHDLKAVRRQQAAERPVRSPEQQQREARDGGRNRGGQRDGDDEGVASPEVVTRKNVRGEETEDD